MADEIRYFIINLPARGQNVSKTEPVVRPASRSRMCLGHVGQVKLRADLHAAVGLQFFEQFGRGFPIGIKVSI